MSMLFASVFLGLVPMAIYAAAVSWLDRWEKEPLALLIAAFGWGCLPSVVFAVVAQIAVGVPLESGDQSLGALLFQASFVAPVTEEFIKGVGLLLIFLLFGDEVDSVLDGLIYGSMIGFGFAAVENVLYFAGQTDPAGLFGLFFLRTFLFGMLHALFTGLTGVGFALGKFSSFPMKLIWPLVGIGLAISTHSLHNYFATMGGGHILAAAIGVSFGTLWFLGTAVYCLVRENEWIRLQLEAEVADETLTEKQASDAANFWKRSSIDFGRGGLLRSFAQRELFHLATKLSYKKQLQMRNGHSAERERDIVELRRKLRSFSIEDLRVAETHRRLPPPLPEREEGNRADRNT